ncbi:hypothetical protein ACIQXD_29805 [Streptomyces uncialis]|uniref:hypothetical protein n=1 Tax=Streptomyces uncialis TaxID=1048205 RepID=UPI00380799F4
MTTTNPEAAHPIEDLAPPPTPAAKKARSPEGFLCPSCDAYAFPPAYLCRCNNR